MHLYPAAMHSACVASCLDVILPQGAVLDPFGGSGTVALESVKRRLSGYTNDLNPLARLITQAKITHYTRDFQNDVQEVIRAVNHIKQQSHSVIECAKKMFPLTEVGQEAKQKDDVLFEEMDKLDIPFPRFKNIAYWFQPQVIIALQQISAVLPDHPFFKMCFSEVVRTTSNRRPGEFKLFRRPVEKLLKYDPDVFAEFEKVLLRNVELLYQDPVPKTKFCVLGNDARTLEDVPDNSVSFVMTSPPYGDSRTTVAYGQFSRLSLQWLNLGEDVNRLDNRLLGGTNKRQIIEMFGTIKTTIDAIQAQDAVRTECKRRSQETKPLGEQKKISHSNRANDVRDFFVDLYESFCAVDKKCMAKTYQVWVVGNRLVNGIRTPLDLFVKEAGEKMGYTCLGILPRTIPYKAMPKQNAPTNEAGVKTDTMTEESIVVLQKG